MSLLESLTGFVKSNMPERAMEGFDSLMDEVRFVPAARDLGAGQYRLAIMHYTVTLEWARFPYRVCDPQLVMALLLAWYQSEAAPAMDSINTDYELPEIDVEKLDEETAIVLVTGSLAEPLDLTEDPGGQFLSMAVAGGWLNRRSGLQNMRRYFLEAVTVHGRCNPR